jgi:hypothetical protein
MSETACPETPVKPPSDALQAGCLYAKNNGFVNGGRQTVTYSAGTSSGPVTGVNPAYWVSYTVKESIPQLFSAVLGKNWGQVAARTTTGVFLDPFGACIYALDPTASPGLTGVGTTNVTSTCGVYVNSNASNAFEAKGGTVINATASRVVGNYNITGGGSITPLPSTGQQAVTDPFLGVTQPDITGKSCDSNGISGGQTVDAHGGIYLICGNITLTGNATQTFKPGIYVVKNGGITWNNGHVSGSNVMFFMTGSSYSGVSIAGNVDVQLSAMSTGDYRGILFFQDRTLPTSAPQSSFTGGSTQILNGSLYFPTTLVVYTGGAQNTQSYTGIVARLVNFKGTSYLYADSNGQNTGLGLPKVGFFE